MTPRGIRQAGGCFLAFCFLGMTGMYLLPMFWSPGPGGPGPGGEGPEPGDAPLPPPKPRTRLEQIDDLRFTPEKALDLCREIIASPKTPAEGAEAKKRLPELLLHAFEPRMQRRQFAEAEAYYRELHADFAGSKEELEARRRWIEYRANLACQAVGKREYDAAAPLFEEVFGDPDLQAPEFVQDDYQQFLLEMWRRARKDGRGEDASAYLSAATTLLVGRNGADRVADALGEEAPPETLIPTGDELNAKGDPASALTYFRAADRARDAGRLKLATEDEASLDERINMCRLSLAMKAKGAGKRTGRASAEDFFRAVVNAKKVEQRLDAAQGMLDLRVEDAQKALEAGQFKEAEEAFRRLLADEACTVWALQCERDGADPLAGVSDDVLKAIGQFRPTERKANATTHILQALAHQRKFMAPLPEARTALDAVPEMRTRMGLNLLISDTDRALQLLRGVLREYPTHRAVEEIRTTIQTQIRQARTDGRFETLLELTGFYVSEIGPPESKDPFRSELFTCLKSAAEHFKEKEPMKRVFLLTLIADAFPGDPAAEPARKEAIEQAMKIASAHRAKADEAPEMTGPSGLDGLSYHRVFNDTGFYLLVFYDGPEKFFARLAPYRHGCVVMKDGKYTLGVAVTAEDVEPYREDVTCKGESFMSAYVIQTEGEAPKDDETSGASITGAFSLLRSPPGTGPFEVEAESGEVKPAGKK